MRATAYARPLCRICYIAGRTAWQGQTRVLSTGRTNRRRPQPSNEADAAAELAAEDDPTLGDTRSGKRSRRERQDSVTDTIMDQRREHIARLRTFEPDAAVVAELRQAGLGRRKQPGDGKIFAKKFENNKRVETGMGAGGFALHIGSASSDWPTFKHNLPEIALAGHTNCGKSTLVNALAGIHPRQRYMCTEVNRFRVAIAAADATSALAPDGPAGISERAGWTDYVSFYQIGRKPPVLTLADLPGYGHAVANRAMQKEWRRMIKDYLSGARQQLCRCCVLIDATRGLAQEDLELMAHLERRSIEHQRCTEITLHSYWLPLQVVLKHSEATSTQCAMLSAAISHLTGIAVQLATAAALKHAPLYCNTPRTLTTDCADEGRPAGTRRGSAVHGSSERRSAVGESPLTTHTSCQWAHWRWCDCALESSEEAQSAGARLSSVAAGSGPQDTGRSQ
eukprot:9282-Heterococcus_DN1.PRE.1